MTRAPAAAIALLLLSGTAQAQDVLLLPAVQYGAPLRLSGGLSVFVPLGETGTMFRQGLIVEGSAGRAGGRASIGLARFIEAFGLDGRAVVTRTWSSPLDAATDSTYGGIEAGLSIAYVRVSAGVARRIAGASGPDATIFTWGAAFQLPRYFKKR